jgi:hypothetical protein
MPSRAELRIGVEWVLRGTVVVVLALLLWQSLHKHEAVVDEEIEAGTLTGMLPQWSVAPSPPRRIHLQLDSVPTPLERDWLEALKAGGSGISWSGDLPGIMIAAQPVASPVGGVRVRIAAPAGSAVELSDEVGIIDTLRSEIAGASVVMSSVPGRLNARVMKQVATTIPRDSIMLHKVLVIGNAGWESKFVVTALEEAGWKVDAFIRIAPGVDVTQGSAAVIDTSRYSAVVALDGAAAPYANRMVDFVRNGGGVVLAPDAAALDAMAPLRSGSIDHAASPVRAIEASGSVSLATLPLTPLSDLRSDAVPLEKRLEAVAVAARRVGTGRALQFGYEDSWRWRMGGSDNSVRDHRRWWTGLASSVAYAPHKASLEGTSISDDAPVARLVAALGPSSPVRAVANRAVIPSHWVAWLFVLLSLALIGEVASRRLRGAG